MPKAPNTSGPIDFSAINLTPVGAAAPAALATPVTATAPTTSAASAIPPTTAPPPGASAPPVAAPATPSTPTTTPEPTTGPGLDDASYLNLLNGLNTGFQQNNDLVNQKNLVLQAAMGNTLTPEQIATLPPDVQAIVQSGNRNNMMLQAQILNDSITQKNASVASSIGYLTSGWQTAQARYDTEMSNLRAWSVSYGVAPGKLIQSVAPDVWANLTDAQKAAFNSIPAPYIPGTVVPASGSSTGTNATYSMNPGTIGNATQNLTGIKYTADTAALGATDSGIQATDGGTFASFASPQDSMNATIAMLQWPLYQKMTLDQALKTWSNGAYGSSVVPGIPGNTPMSSLTSAQLQQVAQGIANNGEQIGTVTPTSPDLSNAPPSSVAPSSGAVWPSAPPSDQIANVTDAGIAQGTGITPSAIHEEAITFGLTNKTPSIGLGSQPKPTAIRSAIQAVAGAIAQASSVNEAVVQQEWSVLKPAQQNSTKQYVQSSINSQTAEGYFATAQQLAAKMDATTLQTASPYINNWIRTGQVQATGNADVNNFVSAVTEGLTEYAKVVAGQTSGQGVTIGANLQAQGLLPAGVTGDMLTGWITNVAQPMMQTRLAAYQEGIGGEIPQDILDYLTVANGGQPGMVTLTPQAGGSNTETIPQPNTSSSSTTDYTAALDKIMSGQ